MKNNGAEQNWWAALSGWLHRHQGRADFLFVYDRNQGRLERCFDRNVAMDAVNMETIHELYRAAAEGRLGLLRPNDLKPHQLTTDPKQIFAPEKETAAAPKEVAAEKKAPAEEEKASVEEEKAPAEKQAEEQKTAENAAAKPVPEERKPEEPKPEERKTDRTVVEQAVNERMREAEAQYRQVVYAPVKAEGPAPTEVQDPAAGKMRMNQMAALEQIMAAIRNGVPAQEGSSSAQMQEQLIAALAQMLMSLGKADHPDEERREREQRARAELLVAQNLFIWAAASDKRDQAAFEAQMDWLDDQQEKLLFEKEKFNKEWKRGMEEMSRELRELDLAGADEGVCKEKIRDYLDGKRPDKKEGAEQREGSEISGETWGNTLRHFCSFAASEVPLSVRHVQAAEQCQKILQFTEELGLSIEELGLDPQEQMAVHGTIEMGTLVTRGLVAQAMLTSENRLPRNQYRQYLQDYLVMKGLEETLIPHVQTHQEAISKGEGPISALQIVMGNPGFRADDLRAKAGRTNIAARLERVDPFRMGQLIRQDSGEIADIGCRLMAAVCQMGTAPEPVREPQAPQKGGPAR